MPITNIQKVYVRLSFGAVISIIGTCILLVQCVYEPKDLYFNPISEPEPLLVNIDLESPEFSDPFYLDFSTNFTFSVERTPKQLLAHVVILDNNHSISSIVQGNKIIFNLNPQSISQGTHIVNIYFGFETGTGSLAEQLGAEYHEYGIEFTIVVSNQLPTLVSPISAKMENGYLTLRWKTTNKRPYQFLVSNGFRNSVIKTFSQDFEYIYVDSGYVGNTTYYSVSASNSFGNHFLGSASSPPPSTHFQLKSSASNLYHLEWTSDIFPANVLIVSAKGLVNVPIATGKFDLDSLHFGDEQNYRLIVSRNTYQDQRFDSAFVLKKEKNIPEFSSLKVTAPTSLYLLSQEELFRLNLSDFQKEDSSRVSSGPPNRYSEFKLSRDGSFITALAFGRSVPIIINKDNLKDATAFGARMYTPTGSIEHAAATRHSPASSNKLLGANILYNGLPTPIVYDLNVDAYAAPFDTFTRLDSANSDTPLLSPDGVFYCLKSRDQFRKEVYKNISGTWSLAGYMPKGEFYFREATGLELISIGSGKVIVYDLAMLPVAAGEFQAVREFTLPPIPIGSRLGQISYDEFSQMISVETIDQFDYSTIRLYDIQSFSYAGSMKASLRSNQFNTAVRHIYSGGYHFVSTGYAEKIIP